MKKLILLFILSISMIFSMATDRTGVIPTGATMLSPTMAFTVADSIDEDETVIFTVTNLQKYMQFQVFTVTLDEISGSASVAITAYGKVTSTSSYVQIGSPVTLTNDGTATITATEPINYNYLKVELVASGATQHSHITSFIIKTANAYDIPANSGTLTVSRADAGTVTITSKDNDANAATTYRAGGTGALTLGAGTGTTAITSSDWAISATGAMTGIGAVTTDGLLTAGAGINVKGAINQTIAGGTVVTSVGVLGGGGTATDALQTLGTGAAKAFSYYLGSTSTTASHEVYGYYMNVNYGTSASSAAPSGDAVRGRAWLVGDASGSNALVGGAFSVELASTGASNTGLTAGLRGNVVLPDGVLTNAGTYYGTEAELFLGGAATDTRAYTAISPLGLVISGTPATSAAQLSNVVAMDINVPANMVTADGTLVVTGATGAVAAGLKISINGTPYWIMLAAADE